MRWLIIGSVLLSMVACHDSSSSNRAEQSSFHSASSHEAPHFDLPQIQQHGELIMLTLYGPESFFEFRGENFGLQYMIAHRYATSIGARIRVEVSRNQQDLVKKLLDGEGDIIAYNMDIVDSLSSELNFIGSREIPAFLDSISRQRQDNAFRLREHSAWAVRKDSPLLTESLSQWMAAHQGDFFDYTTIRVKSSSGRTYTPRRKVSAPILNAAKGQISLYDDIFKTYALQCGWDWRLMAAQAYQESAFDPEAVSFMGAMGLMQLMPSTARDVGVSQSEVFHPQSNVRGAAKLINQLNAHYSFIVNPDERLNFILAAYNAGPGHIDDARALAQKHGKNPDIWLGNVDTYVFNMSQPDYYNQPEVKHGYFRGSETHDYVNSIRTRWGEYKKKIRR